jgi:hypothetical protein
MHAEILRINNVPVYQNRMFETQSEAHACPRGDIVLVHDRDSGLVFNQAFDRKLLDYDGNYENEQACSEAFQRHLEEVRTIFDKHFNGENVIEIGCGKGYFLEQLQRVGYAITGLDPAYSGANPSILKTCFKPGMGITADVVVLRHVLEHMVDPIAFLATVAHANGGRGDIYIEVPCLDWILRRRAWFDIFYEHVNYFRLSVLTEMFETVRDAGHLFAGQYLYIVADLSSLRSTPPGPSERRELEFPDDFFSSLRLASFNASARGTRKAVWGAAAKGAMFVHHMERVGNQIDLVMDINPAKQGKYLAGSGLRVLAPDDAMLRLEPGDHIYIMNSNYLDEIVAQSGNKFRYITVDNL